MSDKTCYTCAVPKYMKEEHYERRLYCSHPKQYRVITMKSCFKCGYYKDKEDEDGQEKVD